MWMLLLAPADAADRSTRWGREDEDASCALAAIEEAFYVQGACDASMDQWNTQLLAYAEEMPIAEVCRDRTSVYVADFDSDRDVQLCARITAGPGAGRNFCSWLDAVVTEQSTMVLTDPIEPAGTSCGYVTERGTFDETEVPPPVVIGRPGGRVVAVLSAEETLACAEEILSEIVMLQVVSDNGRRRTYPRRSRPPLPRR